MAERRSSLARILVAAVALYLSFGASCPPRPPNPTPTPTPLPSPQCVEGQTTCCWHEPPPGTPLYACPAPNAPGGVVNVAGGPAQCLPAGVCGGTGPTPPDPTPPPSGNVPPKGQPQGGDRLLRIISTTDGLRLNSGAKFVPFMAVPCCEGWAKVPNQRWPMASEGFMDETGKYGANWFHFRLGPWFGDAGHESEWEDIGGAYDFNVPDGWNAKFWEKVRALAWHAYQMKAYVEVVPIDTWYVKHCQWGDQQCPWPNSDIQGAYSGTLTPGQEKLLRKAVTEVGCFGNVTWATGNEEDEVPAGGSLYQAYVNIIRDEEQKSGCGFVHVIGTGSSKAGIDADYSITHSTQLTGPVNGRWTLDNEHNPNASPQEEAARDQTATAAGQHFAAWRAGAGDADWETRLQLYKENRGGTPPPVGCFAPDGNDPKWQEPPTEPANHPAKMMAAYNAARAAVGDRCGAVGQCTPDREPCAPPVFLGCIDTSLMVAAEMRKAGHCASGAWGGGPEIAILDPSSGWWEQYHPCATETGCYVGNPYKMAWFYNGQNPTPPTTTPPPTASACPNPIPPKVTKWGGPKRHSNPTGPTNDSTPRFPNNGVRWDGSQATNFCTEIGLPGGDCPARQEGDPERPPCEAVGVSGSDTGKALWRSDGQVVPTDNPFQATCTNCSWLEVCAADGTACSRCQTGANGLCLQ